VDRHKEIVKGYKFSYQAYTQRRRPRLQEPVSVAGHALGGTLKAFPISGRTKHFPSDFIILFNPTL